MLTCFSQISNETTIVKWLRFACKRQMVPPYTEMFFILSIWLVLITEGHVREVRVVSALWVSGWTNGRSAYLTQDWCVCSAGTCANSHVLLLSQYTCDCSTSRKSVPTPVGSKCNFLSVTESFWINPGPVIPPSAVTVGVLLFLSKHAVSPSSATLW